MTRWPSWPARWRGCSPRSMPPARDTHAALERQREFVADASHELRTPLTSLLANLELLAEELGGEQADTAQAALRSARRMRRLVGDLLLLARADARRTVSRGPTDLADVLLEAASELGPMAEDHELSIDAQSADRAGRTRRPPPPHAQPDRERGPAHSDGHAHPRVDRGRQRHRGPHRGGRRSGDTAGARHRVFDRFVRGAGTGTRGSGLGLAIVRAVAESHGGTVALEHPATGTRRAVRDQDPARDHGAPQATPPEPALPGRRRTADGRRGRPRRLLKLLISKQVSADRRISDTHVNQARRRDRRPPASGDRQALAPAAPDSRRARGRAHADPDLGAADGRRARARSGCRTWPTSRASTRRSSRERSRTCSRPAWSSARPTRATAAPPGSSRPRPGKRLAERIRRERTDALNVALEDLDAEQRERHRGRARLARASRRAPQDGRAALTRVIRAGRVTFAALSVPNYRLYYGGQAVSLAGTWMQMTAQAWLVLTLTHSSTALGVVIGAPDPAGPPARPLRRGGRGPRRQAPSDDDPPERDGRAGARSSGCSRSPARSSIGRSACWPHCSGSTTPSRTPLANRSCSRWSAPSTCATPSA